MTEAKSKQHADAAAVKTRRARGVMTVVSFFSALGGIILLGVSDAFEFEREWIYAAAGALMVPLAVGSHRAEVVGRSAWVRWVVPGTAVLMLVMSIGLLARSLNLGGNWPLRSPAIMRTVAAMTLLPGSIGLVFAAVYAPQLTRWSRLAALAAVLLLGIGVVVLQLQAIEFSLGATADAEKIASVTVPIGLVLLALPYCSNLLRRRRFSGLRPAPPVCGFTCLRCGESQSQTSDRCCVRCGFEVEIGTR
ncbi:MAG: hypothetical protein AB8G96_06055 [Phycisphaerales bacterium]